MLGWILLSWPVAGLFVTGWTLYSDAESVDVTIRDCLCAMGAGVIFGWFLVFWILKEKLELNVLNIVVFKNRKKEAEQKKDSESLTKFSGGGTSWP